MRESSKSVAVCHGNRGVGAALRRHKGAERGHSGAFGKTDYYRITTIEKMKKAGIAEGNFLLRCPRFLYSTSN